MSKLLFSVVMQDVKNIHSSIEDREEMRSFRQDVLVSLKPMVKVAFDSRRIDQENTFNPRRNLQYYHRSNAFITKDASEMLKTFFKLKTTADSIREDFQSDPSWMDSYCRILCAALDRTLRVDQKDMDFFQPQIDYLNELLYLRYRLKEDDIVRMNEQELRGIILSKDERLSYRHIFSNYNKPTPIIKAEDGLMDKLFSNVKANKENKEVERSVTITINDKIRDDIKKES